VIRSALLAAALLGGAEVAARQAQRSAPPETSAVPRAEACAAAPLLRADSLFVLGRYWHAWRALPQVRATSRPPSADSVLLRAAVAEGMNRFTEAEDLLKRARGADSLPAALLLSARLDERAERWRAAELKYRRVLALRAAGEEARAAAARLAFVLERIGTRDSAIAAWRRAALTTPELADWFALRRAALETDTAVAFAAVSASRTPGATRSAQLFVAERRLDAGDMLGALDLFRRFGKPLDLARVEYALGRRAQARQRADSALFRDPGNILNPTAFLAATFLTARFDTLTVAENIAVSRAYRARGDHASAVRFAREAVTRGRFLRPDTSVQGWLELARLEAERRSLVAALRAVDSAAVRAGRRRAGLIGAVRVQALAAAERWNEADTLLAQLARVQAGDTNIARVLLQFADRDRAKGSTESERVRYALMVRRFPEAPATSAARFRLGLATYLEGRRDSALVLVHGVVRRDSARTLGPGPRFWAARLRLELGDTSAAADLRRLAAETPLAYYGVRAREVLGDTAFLADTVIPLPRPGTFPPARARERVRLLAALGFDLEARAEATGWVSEAGASPYVLMAAAQAAAEAGYARESIALGEAVRQRVGMVPGAARALFPLAYRSVIEGEAAELCLDPMLLAALIRQESRFDPRAVSKAGARGIGQVMPATGQQLATRLRLGPWDVALLFVPDFNLHLGARYIRDRMDRDSFPVYALLASYNAGPGRVGRWKSWPEYRDPDLFAERVSIAETRDYVRTVYASYVWYRYAWKSPSPAPVAPPSSPVP